MNRVTEEKPETSRHKEKLLKYVFYMFETKIHAKSLSIRYNMCLK